MASDTESVCVSESWSGTSFGASSQGDDSAQMYTNKAEYLESCSPLLPTTDESEGAYTV